MMRSTMLKGGGALIAAALAFSSPAFAGNGRDIVRSGAIGAGGGAVVGAIVPGLSVGEGALIGGVGGAVIGATKKHRSNRYYRDRHGRSYYLDRHGRRVYR